MQCQPATAPASQQHAGVPTTSDVVAALMEMPSRSDAPVSTLAVLVRLASDREGTVGGTPGWACALAQSALTDATARSELCMAEAGRLAAEAAGGDGLAALRPGTPRLQHVLQSLKRPSCLRCENAWDGYHIGYRCYTCARSEHSCICIECFDAGEHEGHNFRLFQSQSGGCCDCGDSMAWKEDGFCSSHNPDTPIDMDALLPREVEVAVHSLLGSIVWLLVWVLKCITLQEGGPTAESMANARVILDWLHELAKLNDGYRVVVCEELLRPRAVIPESDPDAIPGGERSALESLFKYVGFKLPDDLLEMLGFFYIKCLLHAPFKHAFTRCFVRSYSDMIDTMIEPGVVQGESPPVSKFLDLLSCQLFHNADQVAQLVDDERLLHHLLTKLDNYMKKASDARELVVHVADSSLPWASSLGSDDAGGHSGAAPAAETAAATAGGPAVESYLELPTAPGDVSQTVYAINCEDRRVNEQLFMRLCADLRSIITHERIALQTVADPSLLQLLTRVVAGLQSANPHTRQLGRHVEYESRGWQYAFILEFEVTGVLKPILKAFGKCGAPQRLTRAVLLRCGELLLEWRASSVASCIAARDTGADELVPLDVALCDLDLGQHQVSGDPVSFHLTLQRCMSSFAFEAAYRHRGQQGFTLRDLWHLDELPSAFFAFLVDHPIRTQVLCSQIETDRWVRNGAFAMSHQVSLYRNRLWHDMGAELDFFLMQCGAQLLGNAFIVLALQRFELSGFFCTDRETEDDAGLQPGFAPSDYEIAADFLSLIVSLGRDRTRCGLNKEKALRRELVCWLAVGDMSYSQLVDKLSTWTSSKAEAVDAVLKQVADFHEPQREDDSGFYRLKEEEWCRVDQQFPRLSKMNRVKLEERLSTHPWPECMKELELESLWPVFESLPQRVFQSCVLHRIVFATCLKVLRCEDSADLSSLMPLFNYALQACLYGILCTGRPTEEDSETEIPAEAMACSSLATMGGMRRNNTVANMLVPIDLGEGFTPTLLEVMFELKSNDELAHGDNTITVDLVLDELYLRSEECAEHIDRLRDALVVPDEVIAQETALTPNRRREAQERQAAIMAQFAEKQHAFMMDLSSSDEDEDMDQAPGGGGVPYNGEADDTVAVDTFEMECVLCRGPSESPIATVVTMQRSCLLASCSCAAQPAAGGGAAVPVPAPPVVCGTDGAGMAEDDPPPPPQPPPQECQLHIQSCGHTVHLSCLRAYQRTMLAQELAQGAMIDNLMDFGGGEFACPVCRRLSNAALPVLQPWRSDGAGLQPQEQEALCDFLMRARRRKELGDTVSLQDTAQGVVRDVVLLLDGSICTEVAFAAGGAAPREDGLWLTTGQRDCLAGVVRAAGRMVPPTHTEASPPDIAQDLLPQFVAAMLGVATVHSSHRDFLALCQSYYCAVVVQSVLGLLTRLGPGVMDLPFWEFVDVRLAIPLAELRAAVAAQSTGGGGGPAGLIEDHGELGSELEALCSPLLRQMAVLGHLRFDPSLFPLPRSGAADGMLSTLLASLKLPSVGSLLSMSSSSACLADLGAVCESRSAVAGADGGSNSAEYQPLLLAQVQSQSRGGPTAQFSLVDLPEVYVTLLLRHQDCPCALCGEVPKDPALCLVCGALLCFKNADGSGECTAHTKTCCGDVGAYLVLRACAVVLLMGSRRQCIWGSLYLDAHGEKDAYLQRGKTLYLQQSKFRLLTRGLINHSMATDTKSMAKTTRSLQLPA